MLVLVLITKLEHPCAEFLCLFSKHKFIGLIIKQDRSRGWGEGGSGVAIHLKKITQYTRNFPQNQAKYQNLEKKLYFIPMKVHLLLAKILFTQFKIPLCTVYPKTLLTLIKEINKLVVWSDFWHIMFFHIIFQKRFRFIYKKMVEKKVIQGVIIDEEYVLFLPYIRWCV